MFMLLFDFQVFVNIVVQLDFIFGASIVICMMAVTLDDAAVAKLRPAVGDLSVPGPDLVWLEDVHESTMLHNLRLRYARRTKSTVRAPRFAAYFLT